MPRTKTTKAEPMSQSEPRPAAENGSPAEVLTLAEAAVYLRLAEKVVLGAAATQGLPGRQIDGEWRFLKSALQQWLATGTPTWETRKAAILELAGKYKDDPDLEQIVAEAYRRRSRPNRGGGSSKSFSD